MAEMHDARPGAAHGGVATLATFTNLSGAVLSLALIAGVGVWAYKLVVRDVSGVPVIRAVEGPMREQPADPGGRVATHQDLTVQSIAADGTTDDPADRLILAPPPLDLTLADIPREGASPDDNSTPSQEAEALLQNAAVMLGEDPKAETGQGRSGDGLGRSLRPRLRPDVPEAVAFAVAAVRDRNRSAPVEDVDAAAIPEGTRLAQIGVFDTGEAARADWQRMVTRFEGFFEGKQRVVQKTETSGRTFFRLRAKGFADLGEARRFCSALSAEDAECIPVLAR